MSVQGRNPSLNLQAMVSSNRLVGLWRLMTGYHLTYIGATLSLGLAATSKTTTYLLLRYFVDNVLTRGQYSQLPYVALGFIGLALFEGIFTFTSGRLAAETAEGVIRRLRNYLFDHIQRLSFSYHSGTATGELIERCTSDVDAIRRFFSEQAIHVGRIIMLFVINLAVLIDLNLRLALMSVAIVPLIVAISIFFTRKISKAYSAYQEQEAILSTTLQENLAGVRVVKAFARQDYEVEKFDKDNREKFRRGKQLLKINALFWPFSDTLCGLQMLAGYVIGALMVINGSLTIGTYLAYLGLVTWIIFPMRNLGRLIVQMSTGLVSYQRVTEIIKQPREPLDEGTHLPKDNLRGEIAFDRVTFSYEPEFPVLTSVSFSCRPGEVIALLGSTGSGKTSLINLLPRFYDYQDGCILLDGVEIKCYPRHYLRQQIGIVEQEPFLFSRTIRENITYGVHRAVSQSEIEAVARSAAIHDVIMTFPKGYDTLVGERGVTLSGGQKQRLTIARTLLKNPRILIMDDSTSSVDTETEGQIRQALETLMQGRTTFIIAHRIQSIMIADKILVFDQGRIVQQGTHGELIAQDGIYRQIYEIQTRIDVELEKEIRSAE